MVHNVISHEINVGSLTNLSNGIKCQHIYSISSIE